MPLRARASSLGALVRLIASFAFVLPALAAADESIRAIRVWPAKDYTRITIETASPLRYTSTSLKEPDRLVLDLEQVDFVNVLTKWRTRSVQTIRIYGLRTGRFKPGAVRLVIDLKTDVKPQVFTLQPIGDYGHRLVLDLYPLVPPDPLMALVQRKETRDTDAARPRPPAQTESQKTPAKPVERRPLTIVVDAGHGGEDPGARGRRGTHEKEVTLAIARAPEGADRC